MESIETNVFFVQIQYSEKNNNAYICFIFRDLLMCVYDDASFAIVAGFVCVSAGLC